MKHLFIQLMAIIALCLLTPIVKSQELPTASDLVAEMGVGWNLGNSLEATEGETSWGNTATTQELINGVKAAGFNTVRIPCAWNNYSNQETNEIEQSWLARVKEVVDYCINNDMYAVINIHWDGGWLEENPTYATQVEVNEKIASFWWQIASYFKDYDEHLIFAGTNEVRADYGAPTEEYIEVQESFNQTFVYTVRATGGNNTTRTLIVQSYNTNMWHAINYLTLPIDVVSDRLIVETHYYDPYDFTLNTDNSTACTLWGDPYSSGDICDHSQEDDVDLVFGLLKEKFTDNGVPIFIGEFGAGKRTSLSGTNYDLHVASREYFLNYIVKTAISNGLIPVYWDNGFSDNMDFGLFNRETGEVIDPGTIRALTDGQDNSIYYTISNKATQLYINGMNRLTNGSNAGQWSYSNSYNQQWKIEYYDGYVKLQNRTSKLYLGGLHNTENTSNTGQWIKSDSYNQQWIMEDNGTSIFFKNKSTGLYLDGMRNTTDGDDLGQCSYRGNNSQAWLLNSLNSADANTTDRDHLEQLSDSGSDSQSWSLNSFKSANTNTTDSNDKTNNHLKIYPNPFSNLTNIKISDLDNINRIEIVDVRGNLVETIPKAKLNSNIQIGTNLHSGVYIILVHKKNETEAIKVVKCD